MEKQNKPLSKKVFYEYIGESIEGEEYEIMFKKTDVKQAVKEAYSEFRDKLCECYSDEICTACRIVDKVFKAKFGFEL